MSGKRELMQVDAASPYLTRGGRRVFIAGINYVPSYLFGCFWEDFREDHIRRDMERIASLGLNAVPVPIFWHYWEPHPGEFNPEMARIFHRFLDILAENDLYVLPWFLVGICGWLYYPDYVEGRGLLDDDLLEIEQNHIVAFVTEFLTEERILGWDLCDEPSFTEFSQEYAWHRVDPERAKVWTTGLSRAVREVDTRRPITMGLHGAVPQVDGGFHPEKLMDSLDLFGPGGAAGAVGKGGPLDRPRSTLFAAFMVQFHTSLGKATLLSESPMHPSTQMGDALIAGHYRSCLPTALGAGVAGVMPWVYTDFEEAEHYRCPGILRSSSEAEWGIVRADGEIKPQGEELHRFAGLVREMDLSDLRMERAEASLLISSRYYEGLAPEGSGRVGTSFQSHYGGYVLAMTAGRCWGLEREDATPSGGLTYLPGWSHMDPRTMHRLLGAARDGGAVLATYGGPGSLTPLTPELFGVEVQYPVELGGELQCEGLVIPVPECQRLVVRPTSGEVLASFADGTPAAVLNRTGEGKGLLVTFPLERLYLEASVDPGADAAYRAFFALLLRHLDPEPAVRVKGAAASVQVLAAKGRRVVIVTNHLPQPDRVELQLRESVGELSAITPDAPRATADGWELDLGANGYALLEVAGS